MGTSILQLPNEITCHYLQSLNDPSDLARVRETNSSLRSLVEDCITKLEIPQGKMVDYRFLDLVPNVREVEGVIAIKGSLSPEELREATEMISRRVSGDLSLYYIYPQTTEERVFLLRMILDLVLVRGTLYSLHQTTVYILSPSGIQAFSIFVPVGSEHPAGVPSDISAIELSTISYQDGQLTLHLLMGTRGGENVRILRELRPHLQALHPLLRKSSDLRLWLYHFGDRASLPTQELRRILERS